MKQRLQGISQRKKKMDPNFSGVEVPRSPSKNKHVAVKETSRSKDDQESCFPAHENLNELQVQKKASLSSISTPYFAQNFSSSKKAQEVESRRKMEMLNCRVHTFDGPDFVREYSPIAVNEEEEFSGKWISKRYITAEQARKILRETKILRLPKLFAKVRPPTFTEPQYSNWVTIGIISAKSSVKMTTGTKPSRYFTLTLTDFKHTINIYLFGNKNVEKYYNLKVGDIIAVLNPEIWPWRPSKVEHEQSSQAVIKSFNLCIKHNFNSILEIGTSRDFGFCSIYNKLQGKTCGTPINKSVEDRCYYHQEVQFRQVNAKRLELNGNKSLRSPTKNGVKHILYGKNKSGKYDLLPDRYSPQTQSKDSQNVLYFSNPNAARAFFDDDYQNPDFLNNLDSKRRKLEVGKKEKLLQKQLQQVIGKSNSNLFKNETSTKQDEIRRATKNALESGLIKKIGFDPTSGRMSSVLKNNSKGLKEQAKNSAVEEILQIKKEKIELKPSKEALRQKFKKREEVWNHHFKKEGNPNPDVESSDGDSELEIV